MNTKSKMFMLKVTKKTWVWVAVAVGGVLVLSKMMRKKQGAGGENELPGGVPLPVPVPGTSITDLKKSYIGKNAYGSSDGTNVRNSAAVNNGAYNNIVGVLKSGELAGVIQDVTMGQDGKVWYSVRRDANYSCPFLTCGVTLSTSKGFVRSDVVKVIQ